MTDMILSGCKASFDQSIPCQKLKPYFKVFFQIQFCLHQVEPMASFTWEDGSLCCVAMDTGPLGTASYSATEHTVCFPSCIRATLPEDDKILNHW